MSKNFLPISIDIANRKILIIGGGQSAFKKVQQLKRFNADVEIVALKVCDEIKQSNIPVRIKSYSPHDLNGYLMVYSCSNNESLDRQIVNDATKANVLVNIHDKPELCQFVSPAIYKEKHITVSVGSNAKNVYESIRLRDEIGIFLKDHKIIKI